MRCSFPHLIHPLVTVRFSERLVKPCNRTHSAANGFIPNQSPSPLSEPTMNGGGRGSTTTTVGPELASYEFKNAKVVSERAYMGCPFDLHCKDGVDGV